MRQRRTRSAGRPARVRPRPAPAPPPGPAGDSAGSAGRVCRLFVVTAPRRRRPAEVGATRTGHAGPPAAGPPPRATAHGREEGRRIVRSACSCAAGAPPLLAFGPQLTRPLWSLPPRRRRTALAGTMAPGRPARAPGHPGTRAPGHPVVCATGRGTRATTAHRRYR
jgi:hypothetical protein